MSTLPGVSPRASLGDHVVMSMRIPKGLHGDLKRAAVETGMSMATLIECALIEYLNPKAE